MTGSKLVLVRFPRNHQIHGREELLLSTSHQTVRRPRQTIRRLLRALGRNPQRLQPTHQLVNGPPPVPVHPRNGRQVPDTTHHAEIASERIVPRPEIRALCQVLVEFQGEAGVFDGLKALGDFAHVGDTVTLFDAEADLAVVGVVVVVCVRHEPFVDAEDAAGFEDAEDLGVDTFEGGGVDGGFNGVDGVEGVGGEGHLLGWD